MWKGNAPAGELLPAAIAPRVNRCSGPDWLPYEAGLLPWRLAGMLAASKKTTVLLGW